ncbi:MAG TPA: isochorismate synthase [Acidimicrobiia bacterium]|nr:isochorismate synthase [Acidimicrobiia bacterium]
MLLPRTVLSDLESRLDLAADGLRIIEVPVELDPLDLVRAGADATAYAAYFSSPRSGEVGAIGAAHRTFTSGPDRFHDLDDALRRLPSGATVLTGFAFGDDAGRGQWAGFPAAEIVVPEIAVVRRGGAARLVVAVPAGSDGGSTLALLAGLERPGPLLPGGDGDETAEGRPAPTDYLDWVDQAVTAIRAGELSKVVMARAVVMRRALTLDAFAVVARLRDDHPGSWVFGWQAGEAAFVGASPELLVARTGEHMEANPLAGSARRGDDPEQDRKLGEGLLASIKDRDEHELVIVDALERLGPLAEGLHRSPTPQLQRFTTVQHLATPIAGTTRARLLELAAALHPTAAVGGVPRGPALAFIARMEDFERGWYSGGIGWVDPEGDGEVAIALRCALLRGDTATAYAGCGIVAGSVPAEELEETRLKLRPILEVLI